MAGCARKPCRSAWPLGSRPFVTPVFRFAGAVFRTHCAFSLAIVARVGCCVSILEARLAGALGPRNLGFQRCQRHGLGGIGQVHPKRAQTLAETNRQEASQKRRDVLFPRCERVAFHVSSSAVHVAREEVCTFQVRLTPAWASSPDQEGKSATPIVSGVGGSRGILPVGRAPHRKGEKGRQARAIGRKEPCT